MSSRRLTVLAEGLRKRYGSANALDGLDLAVPEGTVCGLLGPNGAGKTTTVRILATLLRFDGGRAEVAGFDVARQAAQVRHHIGLAGQQTTVDEVLTGQENLALCATLQHLDGRAARRRIDELLEQFGLTDAADMPVKHYSGGMRRRLDLAVSLLRVPQVLFLDEPSAGLDPRSRKEVWDAVRSLAAQGTTVLLTTQYLEEADQLATRVAVIEAGRVIAEGAPAELKSEVGGERIDIVVRNSEDLAKATFIARPMAAAEVSVDLDSCRLSVPAQQRATALTAMLRALDDAGVPVADVELRRPTLDDVFLKLTGHRATAEEPEMAS